MKQYLASTDIIDWKHPDILRCSTDIGESNANAVSVSQACYEWVRDRISHSGDCKATVTTCRASEVLKEGTGWCFSKSHLLAALLRANGIPAGLCYQRLRLDDNNGYTLHGFNAVHLPDCGWYRMDARGNKCGVDAQFCPPREKLAWIPEAEGEMTLPGIWPDPVPVVVECLGSYEGWQEVEANLPDIDLIE